MKTADGTEAGIPPSDTRLINRYGSAYLEARAVISYGRFIELCGWVLAIVFVVGGGVLTAKNTRDGVIAIVFGVLVLVLFRLLGAIACVLGQILRASLDSAVFSAPFLDDEQKKRVMDI